MEADVKEAKRLAEEHKDMQTYQDIYKERLEVLRKAKAFDEVIKASQKEKTYEQLGFSTSRIASEYWRTQTMNNLIKQVEQWSKDKGLDKGNPDRQALKFYEEAGEVAAALSRGQSEALKDGIGDTVVTLIILAQQHGMTLEECLQFAYDEIAGRKGKMINGTFVKEADL